MALDFSHTSISLNRPLTSYSKVQQAIAWLIRNKKWFANIKQAGCYLDLGCGPNTDPSYCNVDYLYKPGVDVCWDVTKGLPLPDEYAAGIFTEHMLEHIPFEAALGVLKECRRVLRRGGVLRIVMPDGNLYLREYAKGSRSKIPYAEDDEKNFPFVTPMISVNRIFREHGHLFIWDVQTLTEALKLSGFSNIQEQRFQNGRDARLLRDTPSRQIESLYVEAW
jgi:predicted SAM-dependent methyltransferase